MATNKKLEKLSVNLAESVRDSAEEIWMAGLGAFSKAQREGNKVFDLLVTEGKQLQGKFKGVAGNVSGKFAEKLTDKRVTELTDKAVASWDKLGQVFEDRTSDALGRFGVATKKDTDALSRRVAKLATELEKMKRVPKKAVARRPTV
jgi:poly(hydroxyalkanoate) granule-associated protein